MNSEQACTGTDMRGTSEASASGTARRGLRNEEGCDAGLAGGHALQNARRQ